MREFCPECGRGPRETLNVAPKNPSQPGQHPPSRACAACVASENSRWSKSASRSSILPIISILLVSGVVAATCTPKPDPTPPPSGYDCAHPTVYPRGQVVRVKQPITGQYIVMLKSVPPAGIRSLVSAESTHVQTFAKGYAAMMAAQALSKALADPNTAFVQEDGIKSVSPLPAATTASWGLDRIDQAALPLDGQYNPPGNGAEVHAGIIDTGITDVPDFGGRLSQIGFTAHGTTWEDGHGHGTHVAGTIGGNTWGVAKGVTLHAAKVLSNSGSGSDSQVMAGINWFVTACKQNSWMCVGNMSLGGGASPALDQTVCDAIAEGVQFAIAAGNESENANNSSPARVKQAITVGASSRVDAQAGFSNYGPLLDLFAPGVDITSVQPGGGTATWSGTSMATPHVTGAAVLYKQKNPGASPADIESGLVLASSGGVLTLPAGQGSPNRLLSVKF